MSRLKYFQISLRHTDSGIRHIFLPRNFPSLESLRIGSVDPHWSFQPGFHTVKELGLTYDIDEYATVNETGVFDWNLPFPNVESLCINIWTGKNDYKLLYKQTARLLDGFRNVVHLDLYRSGDHRDEEGSIFKLLTGYPEFEFGADDDLRVTGYVPKGALANLCSGFPPITS